MADRSIAAGDTLRKLFIEFNATAEDIGDIQTSQVQVVLLPVQPMLLKQ